MPSDVVHRGQHAAGRRRLAGRILGRGVGRADHLAHLQSAAGVDHRHRARPVVAAGRRVDPRRPAELAHTPSPARPVASRGRTGRSTSAASAWSYFGSRLFFELLEVVAVRVPAAACLNGHVGDARLDQPPGQQAALAQVVAAIAVAQPGRLALDVEGPLRPWCRSPSRRPSR